MLPRKESSSRLLLSRQVIDTKAHKDHQLEYVKLFNENPVTTIQKMIIDNYIETEG